MIHNSQGAFGYVTDNFFMTDDHVVVYIHHNQSIK